MNSLRQLLRLASVAGFVAAATVHVLTFLQVDLPYERVVSILWNFGLVTWGCALFSIVPLTKGFKSTELWQAALRGCPRWMVKAALILLGYLLVSATVSGLYHVILKIPSGPYESARFSSSSLMVVYSFSFSLFHSAITVTGADQA